MNGGNRLKYKKLIGAGCSFIHGSELGDEVPYSNHTYPALLAQHLGVPYDCVAYPSASNQGIARKIFEYEDKEDCLFVVQWTFPSRLGVTLSYQYTDKSGKKTNWFDLAPNNWDLLGYFQEYKEYTAQLKTLGIDKLSDMVYKHMGNDDYFMFNTKMCIDAVKLHLVESHAKFLFVAGSDAVINHADILSFEHKGFVEWCIEKNFKHGPFKHPLHDAHHNASQYILKHVNIFDD